MNPKAHPDYPYDVNNPFRTETQRIKSLSVSEQMRHEGREQDEWVRVGIAILIAIGFLIYFFTTYVF